MARATSGANTAAQVFLWLAIIGALNWGLVGIFDWDLVRALFGTETSTPSSALSRAVYALVGISGLALAFFAPRLRAVSPERELPAGAAPSGTHPSRV
jgi:uncharacterized membrane protein YuzA (DUF378 family)